MSTLTRERAFAAVEPRPSGSRAALWTGRCLSTLAILFLGLDSLGKLLEVGPVVAGTVALGYEASLVGRLGVILLLCTVVHVIPRTSVLGAVLLTGYLGGATAAHLRVLDPLLSHTLFPVGLGVVLWGGLFLREERLRALLPWRDRD